MTYSESSGFIPQYQSDTGAPNGTLYYNETDGLKKYKGPNGTIHIDATQPVKQLEMDSSQPPAQLHSYPLSKQDLGNSALIITTSVSGAYIASGREYILGDASNGAFTITLPNASDNVTVGAKKTDSSSNAITIAPSSGQIDGSASKQLSAQYDSITAVTDGTNWFIQ